MAQHCTGVCETLSECFCEFYGHSDPSVILGHNLESWAGLRDTLYTEYLKKKFKFSVAQHCTGVSETLSECFCVFSGR